MIFLTVNRISLGCEQNKIIKDVMLGFGKTQEDTFIHQTIN